MGGPRKLLPLHGRWTHRRADPILRACCEPGAGMRAFARVGVPQRLRGGAPRPPEHQDMAASWPPGACSAWCGGRRRGPCRHRRPSCCRRATSGRPRDAVTAEINPVGTTRAGDRRANEPARHRQPPHHRRRPAWVIAQAARAEVARVGRCRAGGRPAQQVSEPQRALANLATPRPAAVDAGRAPPTGRDAPPSRRVAHRGCGRAVPATRAARGRREARGRLSRPAAAPAGRMRLGCAFECPVYAAAVPGSD
jgi:hypothetical protein